VKQLGEIVSIDGGRRIEASDEHLSNAESPRFTSLEVGSNVKSESLVQRLKHDFEIVSIDEGRQSD
jgi:hypothetical protein